MTYVLLRPISQISKVILITLLFCSNSLMAGEVLKPLDAKAKDNIRFSVSDSWGEPYAILDQNSKLVDGVIVEIIQAISAQLKVQYRIIPLSRKRIDVLAKKDAYDIRCFARKDWVSNPDDFYWSEPIFSVINLLVWSDPKLAVKKIEEARGKTVGTVLGYRYPDLDQAFKDGTLIRVDVKSETNVLAMLLNNRVNYAIFESANFAWTIKKQDLKQFQMGKYLEFEVAPVRCALKKDAPISLAEINSVLLKLKKNGFFQKLSEKYKIRI